jgi:hypothetical protein
MTKIMHQLIFFHDKIMHQLIFHDKIMHESTSRDAIASGICAQAVAMHTK